MNRIVGQGESPESTRMLTFRSGGWVLWLAGLLVLGIAAWRIVAIMPTLDYRAVGDGRNVESYGFDLSTCLVPREQVVPAGRDLRKNGLPTLTNPPTIPARDYDPGAKLGDVRKLVSGDRVIGVVFAGEARAYPLWIMNWHEIINDSVGGRPIAVTYSPLCDSVVVFDRRVAGETLEFGISGLLYNSNLLMYDKRPDSVDESLWSQLQFCAIAGPAAAHQQTLDLVPAVVVEWSDWHERHPETTIVLPSPGRDRLYRRDAYQHYASTDKLHYPVTPLPPTSTRPLKTPMIARRGDDGWHVRPVEEAGDVTDSHERISVYSFWFAWYAMHPDPGQD